MEFQFRKATFGGFQRQDVVDYLEKISKEHSAQLEELRGQVTQLEELQARVSQLEEENNALQEERDSATTQLEGTKAKLHGAEGEIATLQAAGSEAQEKIFALTPDAQAFRSVKDRAAGMELDAHVRAQKTIDDAQKQAQLLRNEVRQWAGQVKNQYGTTRGELDLATTHALEDLKTAQKNLETLTQTMSQRDRALEQVLAQWAKDLEKK